MATGGAERNVQGDDFRQTCGLCMESYRGRQPKLLPCFHTFCLPCLTTLAETAATSANTRQKESSTDTKKQEITGAADEVSGGTGGDEGDGGDFSGGLRDAENHHGDTGEVIMFLCPTCRSPVRVPDGGVKNLQANFYLHEADDSSRSVSCELCEDEDQKQDATHACEECRVKLCRSCRRIHDRFPGAGSHHLNPLCQPTDQSVVLQEKMCLYHPDQKLSFFCPTCDVCVCFHCKLTSHNSHDLVDLTAAARQVKLEAKGLQIKANQQVLNQNL
ncbi:hypothetical protein BaRGS_00008328 [Batillaria attramentaria]|uniref:Uncharacterized protein n=1 Tax=Batillaria attramentaria TaxID=370345 RepID=A0ABD0LMD7_9CAEN